MRKLSHWVGWVGAASVLAVAGIAVLLECADPREDEQVSVVTSCAPEAGVFEKLSTDPSSPQSSVVAYVNASEALAAKTAEMTNLLRDGCNDVDTELGLPTGTDPQTACKPIAQRIATVSANQPADLPNLPAIPAWFNMTFAPLCQVDPNARAKCLNSCSVSDAGACDNLHCSSPDQLSGVCNGTCTGTCSTTAGADASVPCQGSCQGTCVDLTADGGAYGGTCRAECNGACAGPPTFTGYCAVGCGVVTKPTNVFVGECDGTCTGTCNGVPINGGIPDGGLPPDAGIPNNADGNCASGTDGGTSPLCVGWCSSKAYGTCGAGSCKGPSFKGGVCQGACVNTCVSGSGAGCVGLCAGTCAQDTGDGGATCAGICTGGTCSGTLTNPTCTAGLNCGQNIECNNACEAAAAATVTCTDPTSFEVETVGDLPLYNALKNKGARLGKALQMLETLRVAEGFVDNRAISDFAAIGATGEIVRACVQRGEAAVTQASAQIQAALAADPTATQ